MASEIFIQLPVALSLVVFVVMATAKSPKFAMPNCNDTCGAVRIPYPFGIGDSSCYLNSWFEIECRASPSKSNQSKLHGSNHKPFLSKLNIEVVDMTFGVFEKKYLTVRLPPLRMCTTNTSAHTPSPRLKIIDLSSSPFDLSASGNLFMAEGCPGSAVLLNQSNIVTAGCGTVCHNSSDTSIPKNSCFGVNCCQSPLTAASGTYEIGFSLQSSGEVKNCMVATLVARNYVDKYSGKLSSSGSFRPVDLYWFEPHNMSCPYHSSHSYYTSGCYCSLYYDGNPYVPDGCQGPPGCEECRGYCHPKFDSSGKSIPYKYHCDNISYQVIYGLSIGFGFLLSVACVYGQCRFIKRRKEMKKRAKFFKRNGGLLLQQQLVANEGIVERTKIFSISELNKATDLFNENRVLGRGGQGIVYKGILTDGSIVAIKKAKLLDDGQLEQFINEVVILSRINHRHVVKLFGCCLETELPLLVYEFIPNGTLFEHIHDPDEDFAISWKMRLKIAADSASAITYLHSSASIPIYHRDIKSSNILLDEKYRAKVSDFGSSKTVAMDQTHLTTLVQGTMGYLDPEYFQSYQFTEKSDVYSFGVVILELLCNKKPIYREGNSMEQKSLVTEFLLLTQDSRLSSILDPKVVGEAKEDELFSVIELAKRCVSLSGKMRPTMKEVAITLEMIIKSPSQVRLWYQQQEDISIQYAGYDEFDMVGLSDVEFIWNTLPTSVTNPPISDEHPLLSDSS